MLSRVFYILFLALFFNSSLFSQEIITFTKIEKDSISIKWLPSNFEQLKLISQGAKVYRIESSRLNNYEQLDFRNAKTWNIEPTLKRFEQLDSSDAYQEKASALLEPLFETSIPSDIENFSFGTVLIENVINPKFQFILGNILVDKSFEKNKKYVYKIEIIGASALYVFIDPSKKTSYSDIDDVELSLDQKKVVSIEWSYKKYEKESFGFDIEHSVDKIKKGDYLMKLPYLPFKSDSEIEDKLALIRDNAEPGHFHYYRVHGRDMFGHKSLTSEWKKIYVPLLIDAWVQIDTIYAKSEQRIINARIHGSSNKLNIDEVQLFRSRKKDTDYYRIEKINFTDSLIVFSIDEKFTGDRYYYKLLATNKDDTVSSLPYYFFTLDQEPPEPPTEINGSIDSNGVVTLKWTASNDSDIRGYKVYRANTKREEFVEKTTELFTTLSFTDTLSLNNLTSEVYYYLRSVDFNFNQSKSSDTILLLKPDTIPPIPCILSNVRMEKDSLIIEWVNSDSEDLYKSKLIRYYQNKVDTLLEWTKEYKHFIDSNIIAGKSYIYKIITFDESMNVSFSNEINRYFEPGYRKPIKKFEAKINKENKLILLTWEKPEDEVFSYKIYKAKQNTKLLLLKTLSKVEQTFFEDKHVSINNSYIYTIKYVNQDGIHSIPAKLEVIYQ